MLKKQTRNCTQVPGKKGIYRFDAAGSVQASPEFRNKKRIELPPGDGVFSEGEGGVESIWYIKQCLHQRNVYTYR